MSLHYLSHLIAYGLQKQRISAAIRHRFGSKSRGSHADIMLMVAIRCLREGRTDWSVSLYTPNCLRTHPHDFFTFYIMGNSIHLFFIEPFQITEKLVVIRWFGNTMLEHQYMRACLRPASFSMTIIRFVIYNFYLAVNEQSLCHKKPLVFQKRATG